MAKISFYRNSSKTYSTPNRPYEKERLDRELRLLGEYGLKCKREVWRYQLTLAKIRKTARTLLTLPEDDQKRLLEGAALLRRLTRLGLLDEEHQRLDYCLSLKVEDFLKRRLQTIVLKNNLAQSIHHARVLIHQGHIQVGKQVVDKPSFMVRVESEKHISLSPSSAYVKGNGRVKRKKANKNKEE